MIELKELLSAAGLSTSGRKAVLITRLEENHSPAPAKKSKKAKPPLKKTMSKKKSPKKAAVWVAAATQAHFGPGRIRRLTRTRRPCMKTMLKYFLICRWPNSRQSSRKTT